MTIEFEPNPGAHRPGEVRRRLLLSGLAGEDISPAAVFLACDAAAMVTGA